MSIDQGEGFKLLPSDVTVQKQDAPIETKPVLKTKAKEEVQKKELRTISNIENRLLKEQKPVNYTQILGDNRMLFIGESHLNNEEQEHIVRHAKDLKAAGITYYAVETVIPDSEFDRLNRGKETDFSTVEVPQGQHKKPYHIRAWRAIANEGITVVPIDIDQKTLDEKKLKGFDKMEAREQFLTDQLKTLMQDENARIAVHIGYIHSYKDRSLWHGRQLPSTARRLTDDGVSVVNATLVSRSDIMLPGDFQYAVDGVNLQDTEFMLDMSPYQTKSIFKDTIEPDYVIHLPDNNLANQKNE